MAVLLLLSLNVIPSSCLLRVHVTVLPGNILPFSSLATAVNVISFASDVPKAETVGIENAGTVPSLAVPSALGL